MSDHTLSSPPPAPESSRPAKAGRSLTLALQEEQRDRWQRGEHVLVEHLERYPEVQGDAEALLDLIYHEILLLEQSGDVPRLEEYLARFPHLARPLRDQFEVHGALASRELFGPMRTVAQTPGGSLPDRNVAPPVDLPGYQVLGELGRGGMGVVYQAWQTRLNRLVALKVLRAGVNADAPERERFRTEAEVAARLQHPHIIQIHEVGEHAGQPFVALEYVDGGNLAQKMAGAPVSARQAAALLEVLARAVQYAHQRGVVHRDLTPNNVLLTAEGQPKIADFGLAKLVIGGAGQTQSGAVLGTPSYMAPEQASGKSKNVGPATDVYALGALLYEALTGRPPFKADTPLDTLLLVASEEPVPPRRLQPRTPHDLETICLKCLAKEPRKRYASAEQLAEDLRRFQVGEPILARPVGAWERGVKWVRRRPALAALLGVSGVAVLALIAALGALWQNAEARATAIAQLGTAEKLLAQRQGQLMRLDEDVKEQQRLLAEKRVEITRLEQEGAQERANVQAAQGVTRRAVYIRDMQFAQAALDKDQPARLLRVLESHLARAGQEDVRGFEWHYLWRLCHRDHFTLHGHTGNVLHVRFAPDGKSLCSVADTGQLKLWDRASGQELAAPQVAAALIHAADFSPDGKFLATGGADGTVTLWDRATGRATASFAAHAAPINTLVFTPDGTALATGSADTTAKLWDVATGRERMVFRGHQGTVTNVAFTPDSRLMATTSADATGKLWVTATGEERYPFHGTAGAWVQRVAFSPDGRTLATAECHPFLKLRIGAVRLWDPATAREVARLDVPGGGAFGVTFTPDGRGLAVGANSGTVRLWDLASRRVRDTLLGHRDRVHAVTFSPDGLTLASTGNDSTVKLWETTARPAPFTLQAHSGFSAVTLTPDGKALFTTGNDGMVKAWDPATGTLRSTFPAHASDNTVPPLACDGKMLAAAGPNGTIKLWDAALGKLLGSLQGPAAQVNALAIAPDGRTLASAAAGGTVTLWDLGTHKTRATLRNGLEIMWAVTFSPDGKWLAASGHNPGDVRVTVWDLASGRSLKEFKTAHFAVLSLAFSPDGKLLASAHYGGAVKVWDTATWDEVAHLTGHTDHILAVAFTPDGKTLASSSEDHTVKLWDVATWLERFTLKGHQAPVSPVAFAADGRLLVTGAHDGAVKLWDATPDDGRAVDRPAVDLTTEAQRAWHRQEAEASEQARQWLAAIWHLDRLIPLGPARAAPGSGLAGVRQSFIEQRQLFTRRAGAYAELGQWQSAAQDYTRTVVLATDNATLWHFLALTRLAHGDDAGYRKACAAMVKRFSHSANEDVKQLVARVCVLAPDALADFAPVVMLAERRAARHPEACLSFHTLGAVLYRGGQTEAAVAKLRMAMAMKNHAKDRGTVEDWLFLALAHQRLGDAAEARKWLEEANRRLNSLLHSGADRLAWHERLSLQLLRREAENRVKAAK
jgi:WD40 repeat protein/predicted Ser/Thr protein kinase